MALRSLSVSSPCPLCNPLRYWPEALIVGRLDASTVLLSRDQYFFGWTLVVSDHHAEDLYALDAVQRAAFDADIAAVSRALQAILRPERMNYATFGNVTPHLHTNLIPRHRHDGHWGDAPWPHTPKEADAGELSGLAGQLRVKAGIRALESARRAASAPPA